MKIKIVKSAYQSVVAYEVLEDGSTKPLFEAGNKVESRTFEVVESSDLPFLPKMTDKQIAKHHPNHDFAESRIKANLKKLTWPDGEEFDYTP